jgi:hypothetical protein
MAGPKGCDRRGKPSSPPGGRPSFGAVQRAAPEPLSTAMNQQHLAGTNSMMVID